MLRHLLAASALAFLSSVATAQILIMTNSTTDTLVSFDPFDGSLIDANMFAIDDTVQVSAIDVNGEIWISQQTGDRIKRYDVNGNPLGEIGPTHAGGGLDNIRGMRFINGLVYVTNSGTANGAPGNAIVVFDTNGDYDSHFTTVGLAPSPFSLLEFQGEVLVASSSANDDVHRFTYAGASIGTFHNSTSLNFAHQLAYASDGNVWCGGFSSNNVVKLDAATGDVLFSFPASGARGVFELGNGNIMWTNSSGAHVYDVGLASSTTILAGGSYHLNLYGGGLGTSFCAGDGSGAACPCANEGDPGHGCANQPGSPGGLLTASGSACVTTGDLVLTGTSLEPNQFALAFQGTLALNGGLGFPLGDGLLCVGGSVIRLEAIGVNSLGVANTTVNIASVGNVSPGNVRLYQLWYRNTATTPCGLANNLTNALEITWVSCP